MVHHLSEERGDPTTQHENLLHVRLAPVLRQLRSLQDAATDWDAFALICSQTLGANGCLITLEEGRSMHVKGAAPQGQPLMVQQERSLVVPLEYNGQSLGSLVVQFAERPSEAQQDLAEILAEYICLQLVSCWLLDTSRETRIRDLFQDLRRGLVPHWQGKLLALDLNQPHIVAAAEVVGPQGNIPLPVTMLPGKIAVQDGPMSLFLLPSTEENELEEIYFQLARTVLFPLYIGTSRPCVGGTYMQGFEQAKIALLGARQVYAEAGGIVHASQENIWRYTSEAQQYQKQIEQLADRPDGLDLLRFLCAYLSNRELKGVAVALDMTENRVKKYLPKLHTAVREVFGDLDLKQLGPRLVPLIQAISLYFKDHPDR